MDWTPQQHDQSTPSQLPHMAINVANIDAGLRRGGSDTEVSCDASKLALSAVDSSDEIDGQNLISVNRPYLSEFLDFFQKKWLMLKLSSRRTSLFILSKRKNN